MNSLYTPDLALLQKGEPPQHPELVDLLCVPNLWLQLMKDYCLDQVITNGGSKVKILYGSSGTGKSHYLKNINLYAAQQGFFTVSIDMMTSEFRLTDLMALYRLMASLIDLEKLNNTLIDKLLKNLGYDSQRWKEHGASLEDFLCEQEGLDRSEAKRQIRIAIHEIVNSLELDFGFRKFMHIYMEALAQKNEEIQALATMWLRGEKIDRYAKASSLLYEALRRDTARSWLYSLIEIIKLMGYQGVVLEIDHFEAILPHKSTFLRYTPTVRNNTYELIRQLIDDLDFLKNMLILIAGSRDIIENEKYGLKSYHALWMRIQPGFEQETRLNVYSDLVDADLIFNELIDDAALEELRSKLIGLGMSIEAQQAVMPLRNTMLYGNFRELFATANQEPQPEI